MLFDIEHKSASFARLKLAGRLTKTTALEPLRNLLSSAPLQNLAGIGLNCTGVTRVNHAGLVSLIELLLEQDPQWRGAYGLTDAMTDPLQACGMLPNLPVFPNIEDMEQNPDFLACQLPFTPAVLLCSSGDIGLGPMPDAGPTALLDILGRPLAQRTLDHFKSFGIQTVFVNADKTSGAVSDFVRDTQTLGQSVIFNGETLSPLALIKRLITHQGLGADSIILHSGHAVGDLNLAKMVQAHNERNADLTLLRSGRREATAKVVRCSANLPANGQRPLFEGVAILRVSAADALADRGLDLAQTVVASGGRVFSYDPCNPTIEVTSAKRYVSVLRHALAGQIKHLAPEGAEHSSGLWVHRTAHLGRRPDLTGRAYVAAHASVARGAALRGFVVVGQGASIGRKTVVRDSIILPGVEVEDGAIIENQIVAPHWSLNHSFVQNRPETTAALDFVRGTDRTEALINLTA